MVVLASGSPRRAEILNQAGIPFVRRLSGPIDETPLSGEPPREYVLRLAGQKARAVAVVDGEIVLAADTAVVVNGQILGKPSDDADAARMLRLLESRAHEVITGICLRDRVRSLLDHAITRVWVASLSEEEIAAYVSSGEPRDKAGAYAIQGLASKFIGRVEGCYFNVVGLPVSLVYRHLCSWYK
ncbi:MAG: septum formation protein Maf [Acidobacteria bacterium]|nr:septum formation protein Maf [Acidobacteriota bacterium]MBI3473530.1 septum formation protein Maf [Candidatus Solibacter usitatus]